jgi:hypothetical protein
MGGTNERVTPPFQENAMFENLESRQFMSATLLATDATAVDAETTATTTSTVEATAKVKPSDIHFTSKMDKASPTLMM